MTTWHTLYITDKTGRKFWNTQASSMALAGEIRTLKRHLTGIVQGSKAYQAVTVDRDSIMLMVDGVVWGDAADTVDNTLDSDELLAMLQE